MPFASKTRTDLLSVPQIRSVRRTGRWTPLLNTTFGRVLIAATSIVFIVGVVTAVFVPLATSRAHRSATTTTTTSTSTTTTSTTATTSTSETTSTSTSTSTTTSSTSTTSTSTSTTTSSTSTTSTSTSTTTSSTSTTSTSTSTTSSSTTTTTTTSTTTTTETTTTTTTTTTTASCSVSATTTQAPGGQGGASVLYTFDNTPNDYYGNYNAVPLNNPQYVSPGYNGRGNAIRLFANQSQCLTIANYMNFYQTSLTVEAWIYPLAVYVSSPYTDSIIYSQTNSSVLNQYMWMMLRNGKNYGAFFANDVTGPTVFQANQWQHMAFTYNYSTTTQVVYVNGVADATNPSAPPCLITSGIQTIGCYFFYNAGLFHGYIDQLAILFSRAKSAAEILIDATLVAYYSMDCLSYSSFDSGPNQINGVAVGLTSNGGRVGQSYVFNSTSSYFQATGLVLLGQSYSPYSFAMWLRPITSVTNGGTILHVSSTTTGSTGWCVPFIGLSSLGQIVLNAYNGTIITVTGPILTLYQWVHIAETYSATNGLRLYVNGVLVGQSAPFNYSSFGGPVVATLGQSLTGNVCAHQGIVPGYYTGHIDEFYIYSRELSQADVTTLANP